MNTVLDVQDVLLDSSVIFNYIDNALNIKIENENEGEEKDG